MVGYHIEPVKRIVFKTMNELLQMGAIHRIGKRKVMHQYYTMVRAAVLFISIQILNVFLHLIYTLYQLKAAVSPLGTQPSSIKPLSFILLQAGL